MTTVVFRNGVMAADSQGCIGTNRVPGPFQKVWRLEDGSLVGGSGDYYQVTTTIAAARTAAELRSPEGYTGCEILCVRPDFSMALYSRGLVQQLGTLDFFSIGSGAPMALAALHNGATAEAAVRAAASVDLFTDDRVQTLAFGGAAQMPVQSAAAPAKPEPRSWWQRLRGAK
jgi:ATP-dependent protease HslVU (ClpYQ) peptidase subunit